MFKSIEYISTKGVVLFSHITIEGSQMKRLISQIHYILQITELIRYVMSFKCLHAVIKIV